MAERLSLRATRVAEVVAASGVSKATVLRYRQTRGDGSPAHGHLPLYEAAITRAIRELPEPAQLQIPSVAGSQPPKRLGGISPTMGQPGEIRSCPPGLGDCTSPTPGTAAETSPTFCSCGNPVEPSREVYAIPTCYACLPPPEPLPHIHRQPSPPRPRLRLELPEGIGVPSPDGHWWEARTA